MADLNVKVGLDKSGFQTGLAAMENAVSGFGNKLTGILAGSFSFAAIGAGISKAIEQGDQLQDIAEKFGVSASKLQMLGNAASVYGSSLENVSAGLNKLSLAQQKAMDGDESLLQTFGEVGISLESLKTLGPEDIFLRIADSFASGANDGRQFLIVNELLGKAQTDLIKVMNQGSAAIIEQGTSMGVWSDETIAALSTASDAIKTFQNQITIGLGAIIPVLNSAIQRYQDFVGAVTLAASARFNPNLDSAARADLMEESSRKIADAVLGRSDLEKEATASTVRNVDERVAAYDREAKGKEAAAERWKKVMQDQIDLDNKEEVTAARIENRAMIREAQRRRDATPGSSNFEKLREQAATEYNRVFNVPVSNEQVYRANPGLRERLSDTAGIGGMKTQQDGPKEATVQSINQKVDAAVRRLDELIRASGTFGM